MLSKSNTKFKFLNSEFVIIWIAKLGSGQYVLINNSLKTPKKYHICKYKHIFYIFMFLPYYFSTF